MKYLFLVGSPRSGTTWLQLLLAQHPRVATTSETHIYTQYMSLLEQRWRHETARKEQGHKVSGLTEVIAEDRFRDAVGAFAKVVLDAVASSKTDAELTVEKTPENAFHAELILDNFPDAYFLNVVRDPRAVVSSFASAADSWWDWTQAGPVGATERWKKNIAAGQKISKLTDRYFQVSYESLKEDGEEQLKQIFKWLGLDCEVDFCKKAYAACSIDNLKSGGSQNMVQPWQVGNEPKGFFRTGAAESWRTDLPAHHIAIIENLAKKHMAALGYDQLSTRMGPKAKVWMVRYSLVKSIISLAYYIGEGLLWRARRWENRY